MVLLKWLYRINLKVAMTMGTPVTTLKRCSTATMPKMVPATRSPRIFEFIDMIRWNRGLNLISFSQNFVIVIEFLDQKNYYNCYYKKKKPPTKTDVSGCFSSRGSKIWTCDLLLRKQDDFISADYQYYTFQGQLCIKNT